MLTIDLRMYRMSGIGRYIRNVLPYILSAVATDRIQVVGDRQDLLQQPWSEDPRVEIINSKVPIYGIGEQALAVSPAFRNAGVLWVPHYSFPLAVTIHDVCHLVFPESLNSSIKRRYARLLLETVARRASAIFCVSHFTASEVEKHLGVPGSKIYVTPPGLEAGWNSGEVIERFSEQSPYFLFVGNVKPNKNLMALLEAFRLIADRLPHRLIVVGKLSNMRTVDTRVLEAAKQLSERVQMVGEVTDEQLKEYYRGATAFVFPSLYEGFGLPVLEAMGLGCPVLCSDTTSLPEVAGDAALYCDPLDPKSLAEGLVRLATDNALSTDLIAKGYRRVQLFSYQKCAEKTASVLNSMLM